MFSQQNTLHRTNRRIFVDFGNLLWPTLSYFAAVAAFLLKLDHQVKIEGMAKRPLYSSGFISHKRRAHHVTLHDHHHHHPNPPHHQQHHHHQQQHHHQKSGTASTSSYSSGDHQCCSSSRSSIADTTALAVVGRILTVNEETANDDNGDGSCSQFERISATNVSCECCRLSVSDFYYFIALFFFLFCSVHLINYLVRKRKR